jgi:hypothetical protein
MGSGVRQRRGRFAIIGIFIFRLLKCRHLYGYHGNGTIDSPGHGPETDSPISAKEPFFQSILRLELQNRTHKSYYFSTGAQI